MTEAHAPKWENRNGAIRTSLSVTTNLKLAQWPNNNPMGQFMGKTPLRHLQFRGCLYGTHLRAHLSVTREYTCALPGHLVIDRGSPLRGCVGPQTCATITTTGSSIGGRASWLSSGTRGCWSVAWATQNDASTRYQGLKEWKLNHRAPPKRAI